MVSTFLHSTGISRFWVAICQFFALTLCFHGCAYKFSNKNIERPAGIRTIAVESIYDTSREVIPHEHLWKHLQRAIVADGNLMLTDRSTADAILRVHLHDGLLTDAGQPILRDKDDKDPEVFDANLPPPPKDFRRLSQAGSFKGTALLTAQLTVELWDLRGRQILFKRNYGMGTSFKTFRIGVTGIENDFLRFEEAKEQQFAAQAELISRRIVRDMLAP